MGAINQALASNKILRLNDSELLGLVQSFDWSPEIGAQEVFEMGSFGKVDTAYELRTNGTIGVNSVGNTAGLFARMIPKRDGSDIFQGYQYNSGGAPGKNAYTFTEADMADTRFDLIQHERPNSKTFSRSLWFPRCQLASFSGSARADGFATETMNWRGPDVVGFNTPYHDIRSIPCTVTDSTHLLLADTTIASATTTLAYVYINDRRFRNATTTDASKFTLGATGGALTLTTTEGYAIPADADCHALVYKTTGATTFPSIQAGERGTTATYVKGSQVNVFIAPVTPGTPLESEKFLKVQSLDWNIDWGLQELSQLQQNDKGSPVYCLVSTLPLSITSNATVYESDWQEWKLMVNKSFTGGVYNETYEFSPGVIKTNFAIVIDYYTKSTPAAKLQRWIFSDMAPNGRGTRTAVRGRGEVSWSFQGTKFSVQGFNV